MYSITATIGRNYSTTLLDSTPMMMTLTRWAQFAEDVEHDMAATVRGAQPAIMVTERHYGKGEWNGVEEESCKVTILAEFDAYPTHVITVITGYLRSLASQYGQDAIALTVGVSEIIRSMSDAEITATAAANRGA